MNGDIEMSDIFTDDIKDLLKLVTDDFDKFYEETEKKSKSSGYYSTAASSGYYSKAASSGDYSTAASSGDYSTAASSGYSSTAASSGDYSTAASSGDYSKAASSGNYSACSALGYRAAVKGDLGNLLMCSEYNKNGKPLGGLATLVDGKKIKAGSWYIVENGAWVEVDYTDEIFSRVISSKGGVKKVKDVNGDIMFIVSSGEFSAHGKTIQEAREALVYKTQSRDVSEYKNMPMDTIKTPKEWAAVYHVTTGACIAGCESFIKSKGKLKSKYTLAEIIEQTRGAYGSEKFRKVVGA
jgi:hypothetical protein